MFKNMLKFRGKQLASGAVVMKECTIMFLMHLIVIVI